MEDGDLPEEIQDKLFAFDDALSQLEEVLKPLIDVPIPQLHANMTALDKAKLDLLGAYAFNSLFWVYLNTKGQNPKEHAIKQELDRIKIYMGRVKEIEDKAKAPKLNTAASKRFIKHALWSAAHKAPEKRSAQSEETSEEGANDTKEPEDDSREPEDGNSNEPPAKKKKKNKKKKAKHHEKATLSFIN